jgi:hypothetical protein
MSWLKRFVALFSSAQAVEQVEQIAVKPKKFAQPRKPAPLKSKSPKKVAPKATQVKSPKPVPKPVRKTTGQKAR